MSGSNEVIQMEHVHNCKSGVEVASPAVLLHAQMEHFDDCENRVDMASPAVYLQARMTRRVAAAPGLTQAQQEFAVLWNVHTRHHPIHADSQVAKACSSFARQHAAEGRLIPGSALWATIRLHLLNLQEYRLLQPSDVDHCLVSLCSV